MPEARPCHGPCEMPFWQQAATTDTDGSFGVPLVSLVCWTEDGGGVRLNESELKPSEMDSPGWAPPQNVKKEALCGAG